MLDKAASLREKLGLRFPELVTKCVLQSQMFSVMEDVHKGPGHPLRKRLWEEWRPALLAIAPKIMEEMPRKTMFPAQTILAFHFMWFDWHDMVTKITVPSASGITDVPPPDFCTIMQNLRLGVFTMLSEYPLWYCQMSTAKIGGGARGGGGDDASRREETMEKPRRQKNKTPAGEKMGGGGRTWDKIPFGEVDETLLCGAANGDRVRVKRMFALVGGPPPLRASDGLIT